jgi:glucose/arabinose dehydrogenase
LPSRDGGFSAEFPPAWVVGATVGVTLLAAAFRPTREPTEDISLPLRPPWTASTVVGTPAPPAPYRTRRAFPHLAFTQPTAFVQSPAGDRWFVTEMEGNVFSFPNDRECREPDLVIDVGELVARLGQEKREELAVGAVYGIVPDPDYATNRFIYLCYSAGYKDWNRTPPLADGTRVVRLTASREDPPRCDPESEVELLAWQGGGHHCGCLVFGPDGCLYVSTGDGGFHEPADGLETGQNVTDLLASILRIDVRRGDGTRPYAIPADNPLLAVPRARGEIFAFGLRNPWKMSFDRVTGELWVGDVGLERTEWVRRVRAGDNCGWSIVDGRESLHPDWPRGPGEIVPPFLEIPHTDAASITGGFVYRGRRFPELVGRYVFGDWETRRLWSVDVESEVPGPRRDLADPVVRGARQDVRTRDEAWRPVVEPSRRDAAAALRRAHVAGLHVRLERRPDRCRTRSRRRQGTRAENRRCGHARGRAAANLAIPQPGRMPSLPQPLGRDHARFQSRAA